MTDLVVFGANGPTGRQVVRQALAAGHHVIAVTRKPDEFPLSSPRLDVVTADVTDPDGVERALSGSQAVISTYGVPYSRNAITVYSVGIGNITQAMMSHGVTRLVCVSSTTVATDEAPDEPMWWRRGVIPFLRNVLGRTLYDDMTRMEEVVQSTDLNWTIVRPAGLFDAAEPTADYESPRGAYLDGSPRGPTLPTPWSGRPPIRSTRARSSKSSPVPVFHRRWPPSGKRSCVAAEA